MSNLKDNDEWFAKVFRVLRPLLQIEQLDTEVRRSTCAELGISQATLYRYMAKLKDRPVASTLHTKTKRTGRRPNTAREELLSNTLDRWYLNQQKRTVSETYRHVVTSFVNEDLEPPSYSTVWRRIKSLPRAHKIKKREGSKSYRSLAPPKSTEYIATDPAETIQIDSTVMDIMVVDSIDREEIGRPTLTVAVDVCTRLITGYHIGLSGVSSSGVAAVIAMSSFPKEDILQRLQIEGTWPTLGVPHSLHMDNGSEHTARCISRGAAEHGIELKFRPVGSPHYGGHVESLIGTLMKKVHGFPGTTFSNPAKKGKYESQKRAILTTTDLERLLVGFIVNEYHHREHTGIRTSPLALYAKHLQRGWANCYPLTSKSMFEADFRLAKRRKITRDGIQIDRISYWSHDIQDWYEKGVESVEVFPINENVTRILARLEKGELVSVPCKSLSIPEVTRTEWKHLKRRVSERNRHDLLTDRQLAEQVSLEQGLIEKARKDTRAVRRRKEQTRHTTKSDGLNPALNFHQEESDTIEFSSEDVLPTSLGFGRGEL